MCIAIVTKVARRNDGGDVRLRAAAAYVEPGAIRDVISELRAGTGNKSELIDKVSYRHLSFCYLREPRLTCTRKPNCSLNAPV